MFRKQMFRKQLQYLSTKQFIDKPSRIETDFVPIPPGIYNATIRSVERNKDSLCINLDIGENNANQ